MPTPMMVSLAPVARTVNAVGVLTGFEDR